jgi:glycosyltransferase involved in cell wall biosynthesis
MQQTDFPIEILIHDDCSTDDTTEIIKEYAVRYPDLIFPLYEEENQYSRGGAGKMDLYNYNRARGKYIAYCEGDDFWTDSLKLQKQVDFMEANPEYSVCFHNCIVFNNWNKEYTTSCHLVTDCDVTLDMFLNSKNGVGQPLTMLFRRDMYNFEWYKCHKRYCDTMEIMHLLLVGKGRFLNFNGGQYNLHQGGVSTTNPDMRRSWEFCEDIQQMWDCTHHYAVKKKYIDVYRWRLEICLENTMMCEFLTTIWQALIHNLPIGIVVSKYALKLLIKRCI